MSIEFQNIFCYLTKGAFIINSKEDMAKNIQAVIKDSGHTVNVALVNSGAGKDLIANMRKGQTPSVEKVVVLAEYLGVSVDYLLFGKTPHLRSARDEKENIFKFSGIDIEQAEHALASYNLMYVTGLLEDLKEEHDEISIALKGGNLLPYERLNQIAKKCNLDNFNTWMECCNQTLCAFEQAALSKKLTLAEFQALEILKEFNKTDQLYLIAELNAAADKLKQEVV